MYPSLMPDLIGIDVLPDRAIEIAGQHGFMGIDLRLTHHLEWIEKFGPTRLADRMNAHGVRPGYASLLTRTLSAPAGEWEPMITNLPRLAKLAQQLGYTRAGVVVLPFHDHFDFNTNRDHHQKRLEEVAPLLDDHGIRLGLEYVSPESRRAVAEFAFVHDLQGMRQLIVDAGQPNVGIMLDSFHWHCAGETAADITALDARDIVVVHVNDAPKDVRVDQLDVRCRELPGATGIIDLDGFIAALAEVGYDGPVTSEPTHDRWTQTRASQAAAMTGRAVRSMLVRVGIPTSERVES